MPYTLGNAAVFIETSTGTSASTNQVWTIWTTSTGSLSTTATNNLTWSSWIDNTSVTLTTTLGSTVWDGWTQQYTLNDAGAAQSTVRRIQQRVQPTAEQLAAWRADEQRQREHAERVSAELRAARARARRLLVACLSPEQRADLEEKKCFYLECHSPDGSKRRYRIDEGTHGNVKLLGEGGKVLGQYCVQPNGVPTEDAMLAQKLWLETNEEEFKRKANFSAWRGAA